MKNKSLRMVLMLVVVAIVVSVLIYGATKDNTKSPQTVSTGAVVDNSLQDAIDNTPFNTTPTPAPKNTTPATEDKPAETPPSTPAKGETVAFPGGFSVTISPTWFYQLNQDNGNDLLYLSTKEYGPDERYTFDQHDQASAFIAQEVSIPTEAIGPIVSVETVKLGQIEATKKVFAGSVEGFGEITQVVYTFKVKDQNFGSTLWTDSKNSQFLSAFDQIMQSLTVN